MSELYLVAYIANAHDEAEPILAVATQNGAGEWHTTEDTRVWPFWTRQLYDLIEVVPTAPPEGWLDHLEAEARAYAAQQRDARRPTGLQALLAAKPKPTPIAPVARRGF